MGYVSPPFEYGSARKNKRNLAPGSVKVSWTTGGQQYQLTDNGDGTLSGNGTGDVSYSTGLLTLHPKPAPGPSDGYFEVEFEDWRGENKSTGTITLAANGSTV